MSTAIDMNSLKTKLKEYWVKYESKIILLVGFVLIAVISFEIGTLKAANFTQKPLIIEKQATLDNAPSGAPAQAQNLTPETPLGSTSTPTPPANCTFVGSKNSNKYHLPTCRYAKGIKVENRVCFSSQDEAQSKGYVPDKNCIK
jgi:hypothetical protein